MNSQLSTASHLQLAGLSSRARADFHFWQDRLTPILALKKGMIPALKALAAAEGLSIKTVTRKYYLARNKGWDALVNRSLAGPKLWKSKQPIGLSSEDIELVKFYCANNQRSSHSALKQLRRDWVRKGICTAMRHKVGADGAARIVTLLRKDRKLGSNGYPIGWSVSNLQEHKPTKFQLKTIRLGRSAAATERRLVYTTRKGLYVASHYMLDDMWHNFEVNSFAERQAGRPLELFSHDLYSARKVRWGIRVRTRRDDGSHNQLSERMTRMILAATLFLDGYSTRGTVIVAEHGTAAVREGIEQALLEISDGLITVARSGMTGAAAHSGQYPGISRGNFRFKASLESSNNLVQNVFAALPGQTGKDRNHQPEAHPALMRNNENLLAARNYLSDEAAALLEFPILELNQFMAVAHELYSAIDNDPEHELEGWVECGHVAQELLMGGQWIDQTLLLKDAAQSALALELINAGTLVARPRKMTRGEVWRAGAGELVQIPGYGVCAILGDDLAVERKVRANRFEFEDKEVGPGEHRYEAIAFNSHGEALRLADRETYETFVNPFAPETMFVRRGNGAYIGECRRIDKPCRRDVEAVHRACGAAAKEEAALLAPIRARHLDEGREKLRRHTRNAAVISGKPLTIGDRASRDRIHEIQRDLSAEDREAAIRPMSPICPTEPDQFSSEEISTLFATTPEGANE